MRVKLRARWIGHPPCSGDYLMAAVRPRYAYCIEKVTNASSKVSWDSVAKAEARRLQIDATRVARDAVPSCARIHSWTWDKRAGRTLR